MYYEYKHSHYLHNQQELQVLMKLQRNLIHLLVLRTVYPQVGHMSFSILVD